MLITCFLLIAISLFLRKRYLPGSLILGLSIGIKFVTITALPWVLMEYVRGKERRTRAIMSLAIVALTLMPAVLCYMPFIGDGSPLAGLIQRWAWGVHRPSLGEEITGNRLHVLLGVVGRACLGKPLPLVIIFAGLTFWLWFDRKPGKWLAAWVLFSIVMIPLTAGIPFPWYFIWPWAVSLSCWDRLHVRLSAVCLVMTFVLSFVYSISAL